MTKRPLFVCFSGIDGSGKTTSAQGLLEYLSERGLAAKYVWLNSKPIVLSPIRRLAHKTILHDVDRQGDYQAYYLQRQSYVSKWKLARKVYYGIMLLDYILWVYWNLRHYYLSGVNIVCDRYVYDLVINLGDILGYSSEEEVRLIRFLQHVLPRPTHVLICDVDEETALRRKSDTPHLSYLKAHRPRYRHIAEAFRFPVLDASLPVEIVTSQVRQIVEGYLAE